MRQFSFDRLTVHYTQRKAMKLWIDELRQRQAHQDKPFSQKCMEFFTKKKRRFFYMLMLYGLYHYYRRITNFFRTRKQRTINKYKKRFITRYNPKSITFTLPESFQYKPEKLTQESVNKLGACFLDGERRLKNGFSRQLIINILTALGKMDENQQKEFLSASGYRTMRKRILCSCNMKEFLELIESKIVVDENGISNEAQLIDGFIHEYNEEIDDFEDRVEKLIKEIELKNLGSHDEELNKEEKKKREEEKKLEKEAASNKTVEDQNNAQNAKQ
ncbi:UNKNOWN [Stylonychia lemnae]|uniref:Uncharacterized protein n=1 Tax=Stylonychia lemnae TaxID=5949 RepID=A0A078AW92_STYLE|nr:UNKNOWN [Stylonychia lemnae]|eukprot:CDW85068.1 UNKNOWN [Stylonychia lemnae]